MKMTRLCGLLSAILVLCSCNDKIEVQQEYDFSLSTWYLQKTILPNAPVEIRFYLTRAGYFEDAEYSISYTQIEGKGIVTDTGNKPLVNREYRELKDIPGLEDGVFTLYYRSTSTKNSTLRFTVRDNFGNERELQIEFQNET